MAGNTANAVDILIVTPLVEEWMAVRRRLVNPTVVTGANPSVRGQIGQYSILAYFPGGKGTNNAMAAAITQALNTLHPRWILLVGIAAGFPSENAQIERGDVVIASKVYPYEYGKVDQGQFRRRDAFDFAPDQSLMSYVQVLEYTISRDGWQDFSSIPPTKQDTRPSGPRIWIGPIASGDKVIDDPTYEYFRQVKAQLPDILAVEMEAAGAAVSTSLVRDMTNQIVGLLVIRGISDLPRSPDSGDDMFSRSTTERDTRKEYAADAAAAVVHRLLTSAGVPQPISAASAGTTSTDASRPSAETTAGVIHATSSNGPQDTTSLQKSVRDLMRRSDSQIELLQMIRNELNTTSTKTTPINANLNSTGLRVSERVLIYVDASQRLAAIATEIGTYASNDQLFSILPRMLSSLIVTDSRSGLSSLLNLRSLPALMVLYAGGVAAVVRKNWICLAEVLRSKVTVSIQDGHSKSIVCRLRYNVVLDGEIVSQIDEFSAKPPTPSADYLHLIVRELVSEYVLNDAEFDRAFHLFEFIVALLTSTYEPDRFPAIGRFTYSGTAKHMIDEFLKGILNGEPDASLVFTEVFGGNRAELLKAASHLDSSIAMLSTPWWGSKFDNFSAVLRED